ncbi:MAG: FAD-binding oxidoreductase [Dehalococcoidia bacterium]|nr:MAG: FAD-binding oxidoreductase [Dehalococcoidia bacterium]
MAEESLLHNLLESTLDSQRVFPQEEAVSYAVDGVIPQVVAMPETIEEVAEVMRLASREDAAVIPWGGGTTMRLGNIPRRYDIALSLSHLNQVVEYEPSDLTATVQAGKTLADFQRHLAEHSQSLALDPPSAQEATIGGILAVNASGPSRHAYGTARDLILGMRAVQADGRIIKAGGRVVKNVAGYDLGRLFIGSLGSLGIIVEASFRLAPVPRAERTAIVSLPSAREAWRFAAQTANLGLRAVELLNAEAVRQATTPSAPAKDGYALVLAAAGEPAALERSLKEIDELSRRTDAASFAEIDESAQDELWQAIARLTRPSSSDAALVCKSAVLPSQVPTLSEQIETARRELAIEPQVVSHLTAGVVYSTWPFPQDEDIQRPLDVVTKLHRTVARLGGSLIVETCPSALKEKIDVWGEPAADFPLMRRLKEQFDPQGILNPGRFLGRL